MQNMIAARDNLVGAGEDLLKCALASGQIGETIAEKDLELLIPMTEMLFVRGRLQDPQNLMVEIGAGMLMERYLNLFFLSFVTNFICFSMSFKI